MATPKILMVHNKYAQFGGEDESFDLECDVLRKNGCSVDTLVYENATINGMGKFRLLLNSLWNINLYSRLSKAFKESSYDVVHVQNNFPLVSPSLYYVCQKNNLPVVQAVRNYRLLCPSGSFYRQGKDCFDCKNKSFPWPAAFNRCYKQSFSASFVAALIVYIHKLIGAASNNVSCYIAVSNFVRDQLISAGIPENKIFVKPNFYVNSRDGGSKIAARSGVVYLGRISAEKGVDNLVDFWVRSNTKDFLFLYGDGDSLNYLADKYSNFSNIVFKGKLDHSGISAVLAGARFLIVPSLWNEPFGRVVVEAFAHSTPVMIAATGGLPEIVTEGITGSLYDPRSFDSFLSSLKRINDYIDSGDIGRACFDEFNKNFSEQRNFELMISIYSASKRK